MASNKAALQYITDNSTRCDTFQKRCRDLVKKANKVATLCNAKFCIVVYGEGESVPQVFSSHNEEVAILNRFRGIMEYEQFNKKMDHESFLEKRIGKLQDQVYQSSQDCKEHEIKVDQPSQAQVPTPYDTVSVETIGAPTQSQASSQQQEEWLEMMRTRGGDLGALVYSGFKGGATTQATAGLNGDEMMHPFELGAGINYSWDDTDSGSSSSSFTPM